MASQHREALRLPAALLVLSLLAAACGGERARPAGGADTTGTAVAKPDSAAMPVTDTAAHRDSTTASAADTTAKPSAAAPAAAPKTPTSDTGAKRHAATTVPAKKAAVKPAKADSSKSAAAAAQNTEAPLRDAYHQAPHDTVTQAVYDGWKQFNLNCARCHGEDVLGTTIAPHLILSLKPDGPINTKELFMQTVCAGRPTKGMPSWCALGLGMDKIDEIYQYVKGRSDAKIGPGRPAVKQQG
jgi:mono/diheme cytochrome c family protein